MKELIEIIGIIKSGRITRPEKIRPLNGQLEGPSQRLYRLLMTKKHLNDDEAMKALYGKNVGGKADRGNSNKYNVLKKRLKEWIFPAVLFPANGKVPAKGYPGAIVYCYRNFTIARMLFFFGVRVSGRRLMNNVLVRAREFEIFDVALLSVIALRREMVTSGDVRLFDGYKKDLETFQQNLDAEMAIEGIYYDLELPLATKLYISQDVVEAAAKGLKKAKRILKDYPTYRVRNIYNDIKILDCQVQGTLVQAAKECDKAITALKSNKTMYSPGRHGAYLVRKMDSLLLSNKTDEAYKCASQCVRVYLPGTHNWYITQALLFLAQINDPTLPLKDAFDTYTDCISHPQFKTLEMPDQEKWHIFGGYLWFMLTYHNKIAERESVFGKGKVFDLAALSKKIATTQKDKKGVFVSFTILKVLIYIEERQIKNIESSIVSLKNYLTFHLRGDNGRGRNFIKLLLAIIENEGKQHKNIPLINRLSRALERSEPMITANQLQIEVISYSKLWKMAEEMVKKKK